VLEVVLEVLEVLKGVRCALLEAVDGVLCLLEVLDMVRRMPFRMPETVEAYDMCWSCWR
jgi:hypothetical protein